jgi:hypothetical protein
MVASRVDPSKLVVIIIDGLDETDASQLRYTSSILSRALADLPNNVKVFVSSRTEDDIRRPFSDTFRANQVKHVHLDMATPSSICDVSTFLLRKIVEISEENELKMSQWPGEERMKNLCDRPSGLFIWAVTATNSIQDQIAIAGRECIENVLNELSSQGMRDINMLYGTILRVAYKNAGTWAFQRIRRIMGWITVLQEPLCVADISVFFSLLNPFSSAPVDVENFVRRLRTLLVAGTDPVGPHTTPRLYQSFFDYIVNRAEARFRVDIDFSHGEIAMQCLQHLISHGEDLPDFDNIDLDVSTTPASIFPSCDFHLNQNIATKWKASLKHGGSSLPSLFRYACRFWDFHLPKIKGMTNGVLCVATRRP